MKDTLMCQPNLVFAFKISWQFQQPSAATVVCSVLFPLMRNGMFYFSQHRSPVRREKCCKPSSSYILHKSLTFKTEFMLYKFKTDFCTSSDIKNTS